MTATSRPRLLDLFCGAGGCSVGYHRAGFDVTGVDIADQPNYPYDFHRFEAIGLLTRLIDCEPPWTFGCATGLNEFDAIHVSPPCQKFTAYRRRGAGVGDSYPDLISPLRSLLRATGLPYVIENVAGAPLASPVMLCGSSFGLDVRRHRFFETGGFEPGLVPPCSHGSQRPRYAHATNRSNLRRTVEVGVWRIPLAVQRAAMGIAWMALDELTEAIPPAYTEFLGAALMASVREGSEAA